MFTLEAFSALAVLGRGAAIAKLVRALPALGESDDVSHRRLGNIVECLLGQKRLVRGDDHVGHRDQSCEHVVLENVPRVVLEEKIGFTDIFRLTESVVKSYKNIENPTLDDILLCDSDVRRLTTDIYNRKAW